MFDAFAQILSPINGSLGFSALVAAIPLATLFILLGVFKVPAWVASLVTVVLTAIIAVAAWQMPVGTTLSATAEGVFFGACQIMWILIAAVWMYNLTVKLGWDKVLRDLLRGISDDLRVLSILIAFCFGALLEALAGFGTPVAITAAMLVAAGMKPIKSAVVCMLANTAPVAFGAMGAPITTLANTAAAGVGDGSIPAAELANFLGMMAGRQSPFMAMIVPLFLVVLVDGLRGLKDTWHIALSAGVVFAIFQFLASNFVGYQITDVIAAVACILAILILVRVFKPANPVLAETASSDEEVTEAMQTKGGARVWGAIAPYAIVVVLFSLSQIPNLKKWLSTTLTVNFAWPGLQDGLFPKDDAGKVIPQELDFCGINTAGQAAAGTVTSCTIGQVSLYSVLSTGTILFIGGLITALVYRMSAKKAAGVFGTTIKNLRFTIITIACVLAVAYIMNGSGMTVSLGTAVAGVGAAFAFLSPVLGWVGVGITGSDTSSNALFGGMQVAAAQTVWPDSVAHQILMATSNSTGGCMGKMISPQSLSVAAAASGMLNKEGEIFRKVVGWSLVLLIIFACLVTLQATVLTAMVPVP
ncbi:MAG: L-lactate permease [Propionibacteriaceae bacterium]|nr:L-lactate permease [Propionibacteriaceae bacterium]